MVHNQEKLDFATHLRKRGFSYADIAKTVGVSKGTLSNWFAKKKFSKEVKADNAARAARENAKRLSVIGKHRAKERARRQSGVIRTATTTYRHYKANPLFTAGITIYLMQGNLSASAPIKLTTTNQTAQRIFGKFVREFLGVSHETIKYQLYLTPLQDAETCKKAWQQHLKLKAAYWHAPQLINKQSDRVPLHNGVLSTIISDTVLKQTLTEWVRLASKELSK